MASNRSRTMTTEQIQTRCRTLVLKLTQPPKNSAESEPERMVNNLRERVNQRFHMLMQRFVIDQNDQINAELLEKLKKVKDPETFLEAFLTHLYGKAVKDEEAVVAPNVTEEEKSEINHMVEEVHRKENKP